MSNRISIKSFIKKAIKNRLPRLNFISTSKVDLEILVKYYAVFSKEIQCQNNDLISLVFSKDRAMQLHAFLCSYFENIDNFSEIFVLFKASNREHKDSYTQLIEMFSNQPVIFIEENDFRHQLIKIISSQSAERIVFYVDDMIFTHRFNYTLLSEINPYEAIISLSRGRDLNYSAVLEKPIKTPDFKTVKDNLLTFYWDEIKEYSDWSYPLGVSGYMFAKNEILSMIQILSFNAPNSLEGSMQAFMPIFKSRKGFCPENAVSVCIHANITQTEGYNPVLGSFTIDDLLQKWKSGKIIDFKKFYNQPAAVTQKLIYTFLERDFAE